ncbi:replication protein [Bacillus sp. JJ1122]|uniref:replication protein n=1 Tax=Bacillus sp. JJ1122 TaxID=3122951 RepID=UPI002FFE1793
MANVQLEHGYTRVANETLEKMAKIRLSGTQYRILFIVWRYTYGFNRKEHTMSLSFLQKATGCDQRQIQRELKSLENRRVIVQSIQPGSIRKISFNKNHDEWVYKQAIGKTSVGNIDNGESVKDATGKIDKSFLGEIDKEEKNKENHKETDPNGFNIPNPFKEYERLFGTFPTVTFRKQITEWIVDSQFNHPEAIICEVLGRAKKNSPIDPPRYIQSILKRIHGLGLYTLSAVQDYNTKYDETSKSLLNQRGSSHNLSLVRPSHWEKPLDLTEEELKLLEEKSAELI